MTAVGHVGDVIVATTQNKGHDPDFWADAATKRIVSVGANSHPLLAEQALSFQEDIRKVIGYYIKEAIRSDRVTLAAEVESQGQPDLANIIRRLT
jgi:hypothetical protein|tara:strand:+ start:1026 stop:1310 length:285 start_codon:yes stop_codon:yes gene_type:complete